MLHLQTGKQEPMGRQLAALSGLAILLVIVNHSIHMAGVGSQELGYPQAEGWRCLLLVIGSGLGIFAVPIFLFTSGSFISYAARRNPPSLPWKSVWAAVKRILWPYLFWSVAFYLLIYVQNNDVFTPYGYVRNLLIGYPFHFIPPLLFFYILAPVLVRLVDRLGFVVVLVIGFYQLLLIGLMYPRTLGLPWPSWMHILVPPVLAQPLAWWAIYFPLGLFFGLKARTVMPWLKRFRLVFAAATIGLLVLHILDITAILNVPLVEYLCPLLFLFMASTIERNSIPKVRQLEMLSRRVYGLYLTHLIVLDLVVLSVQVLVPGLLAYPVLSSLLLFFVGLGVPLLVMNGIARLPTRRVYRYVFG
jgi:peptidoglycan/LPS O-acetylase OafA/YrhL